MLHRTMPHRLLFPALFKYPRVKPTTHYTRKHPISGKCDFAHSALELRVKENRRGRWGQKVSTSGASYVDCSSEQSLRESGGEDVLGSARSIEKVRAAEGSVSEFERSSSGAKKGKGQSVSSSSSSSSSGPHYSSDSTHQHLLQQQQQQQQQYYQQQRRSLHYHYGGDAQSQGLQQQQQQQQYYYQNSINQNQHTHTYPSPPPVQNHTHSHINTHTPSTPTTHSGTGIGVGTGVGTGVSGAGNPSFSSTAEFPSLKKAQT